MEIPPTSLRISPTLSEYLIESHKTGFTDGLLINSYSVYENKNIGIIIPEQHVLTSNFGRIEPTDNQNLYGCALVTTNININSIIGLSSFAKLSNILVKGCLNDDNSIQSVEQNGICSINNAQNLQRRITIENVGVLRVNKGFVINSFSTTIIKCIAQICNIGFSIQSSTSSPITGINISNCVAARVRSAGFLLQNVIYSRITNSAVDRLGSYYAASEATNYSLDYAAFAYKLDNCKSVTVDSCGTEFCNQICFLNGCVGCIINPIFIYTVEEPTLIETNKYQIYKFGENAIGKALVANTISVSNIPTAQSPSNYFVIRIEAPAASRQNSLFILQKLEVQDIGVSDSKASQSFRITRNYPKAASNLSNISSRLNNKDVGLITWDETLKRLAVFDGNNFVDINGFTLENIKGGPSLLPLNPIDGQMFYNTVTHLWTYFNLFSNKFCNIGDGFVAGKRVGTEADYATFTETDKGLCFYRTDLKRPFWLGVNKVFRDSEGIKITVLRTGTKAQRPVGADIYIGFQYMQVDTTYGTFPIWASAISGNTVTWVKADGTNPDAV